MDYSERVLLSLTTLALLGDAPYGWYTEELVGDRAMLEADALAIGLEDLAEHYLVERREGLRHMRLTPNGKEACARLVARM